MADDKKGIKFGWYEMGRFLKHFIISITLLALCGSYITVVVKGKDSFLAANDYLIFILTIIASVLSIVSLVLSYQNARQSEEMRKEISVKLAEISAKLPDNLVDKKATDWKPKE